MRWYQLPFLFAILACAKSSDPVRLGAAGPWKEGYGAMNKRGIELALEEVNRAGGIQGRPLEIVMRDDEGSGQKAAAIAKEFVADPTIAAVIGHVNSGAMVAAARVYDNHLTALATTATSPDLSGISRWVFRVISSDSANGLNIAHFAAKLGRKKAAILYENDSYGRGLAESFQRNFEGEIVISDPIADTDEQDFEPHVANLKRLSPDMVFVATTERAGIALLREARRQGLRADFFGGDGWTGIVSDTAASEGVYVGAPFAPSDPRPEAQRFVTTFKAKYGTTPDGNAALAYDATILLARALAEKGGSREEVRSYLALLNEATSHRGVTGPIHFGMSGDPVGKGFVMTRIHAGELHVAAGSR